MDLESMSHLVMIIGAVCGAINYFVLKPVSTQVTDIRVTVKEIQRELTNSREQIEEVKIKLAEVDQRARSAHHRIDGIVDICEKTHGVKIGRGGET